MERYRESYTDTQNIEFAHLITLSINEKAQRCCDFHWPPGSTPPRLIFSLALNTHLVLEKERRWTVHVSWQPVSPDWSAIYLYSTALSSSSILGAVFMFLKQHLNTSFSNLHHVATLWTLLQGLERGRMMTNASPVALVGYMEYILQKKKVFISSHPSPTRIWYRSTVALIQVIRVLLPYSVFWTESSLRRESLVSEAYRCLPEAKCRYSRIYLDVITAFLAAGKRDWEPPGVNAEKSTSPHHSVYPHTCYDCFSCNPNLAGLHRLYLLAAG